MKLNKNLDLYKEIKSTRKGKNKSKYRRHFLFFLIAIKENWLEQK